MFSSISTVGVPLALGLSIAWAMFVLSGSWKRYYFEAFAFDGLVHSVAGVLAFFAFKSIDWEDGFNPPLLLAFVVGTPPLVLGIWHLVGYFHNPTRRMKMQVAKSLQLLLVLHLVYFGMLIFVHT